MASNMPVRELLSPEKVLASLKSSGTFDRFRKSCMASVELEPMYLQHAEYLRQSGEDYLSKETRASSVTKNDMRNELRGHIIKELSKPDVQKNLEDMITEVIKKIEDEISGMISDAVHQLTKAEESAETPNIDPSCSQATPTYPLSKEAPKETALELLDAFGVSASDAKKRGSKEAVGMSKAKPTSSEPKRGLSGGKHRGVAPGLSQVKPFIDAEQNLDDKETGNSKCTTKRQHHLHLSSSDESGNADGEESDNQSPLGEPELQPKHTSTKSSHERKEPGLALQLQAAKKHSAQKRESQHTLTMPSATKTAVVDSKGGPDNPHLPVAGPHHSSRHSLKRPFSSTEVASKDGSGLQDQAKRKKRFHEDVAGEECAVEPDKARVGDGSSRRAKQNMIMVTRSQSRKS